MVLYTKVYKLERKMDKMDDLLNRQMPHSLDAEQAVLGSILIDSRCAGDITDILRAEDFYFPVNQDIFRTVYSMFNFNKPIDPVTVIEQMREDGVWTDDTPGYIRDLMLMTPTAANVTDYTTFSSLERLYDE